MEYLYYCGNFYSNNSANNILWSIKGHFACSLECTAKFGELYCLPQSLESTVTP